MFVHISPIWYDIFTQIAGVFSANLCSVVSFFIIRNIFDSKNYFRHTASGVLNRPKMFYSELLF